MLIIGQIVGSGYTVEGQKTGEEKHGGLQIEIIPRLQPELRVWMKSAGIPIDPEKFPELSLSPSHRLEERKTPRHLGLAPGEKIRSYPPLAFKKMPCSVSDIVSGGEQQASLSVIPQVIDGKNLADCFVRLYTHNPWYNPWGILGAMAATGP
jgi:hypothetical protein